MMRRMLQKIKSISHKEVIDDSQEVRELKEAIDKLTKQAKIKDDWINYFSGEIERNKNEIREYKKKENMSSQKIEILEDVLRTATAGTISSEAYAERPTKGV